MASMKRNNDGELISFLNESSVIHISSEAFVANAAQLTC